MKKSILYTVFLGFAALFTACDEVSEGERYISLPQVETKRNVLLEDFTGQFCSNCPTAHATINSLKAQYGSSLIAVSVHATDVFGIMEGQYPTIVGLMQPEGNIYAAKWGASDLPTGIINRSGGLCNYDKWGTAVREALAKDTKVAIELSADTVPGKDSIAITVELNPSAMVYGKLQLWITESNITALQQNGPNLDVNYVHNHVFRACVNGTWGEDVALQENVHQTLERGIRVKSNWVKENLSVVAFVYNDAEGVMQAAECELK